MTRVFRIFVVALLALCAGCRTSRRAPNRPSAAPPLALLAECGACGPSELRPGWPLATAKSRGANYGAATKIIADYRAFWLELMRRHGKDACPIPSDYFTSQRILDRALLLPQLTPGEQQAIERLRLVHNWEASALQAHNALAEDIHAPTAMQAALAAATVLNTLRRVSAAPFASWMPARLQWEASHGDWAGMAWAELFEGRRPLARIPDDWLLRIDNLREGLAGNWQALSTESWQKASSQPFKLSSNRQEKLPSGNAPVWLRQTITAPEGKPPTCLAFRAFPGKCMVYLEGKAAYHKQTAAPQTFAVPWPPNGSSRTCHLTILFPDGIPANSPFWPVWLAIDK